MKEKLVKETKPDQYIYTMVAPLMMAPLVLIKGIDMNNYLLIVLGMIGAAIIIFGSINYFNRKGLADNYILKVTDEGIIDNPFFGKERLILRSDIKSISSDTWMNNKRLVIEFNDPQAFVSRNKLRLTERLNLSVFKGPYRISLMACDQTVEEVIELIKSS